jgi:hypothetical protein
MFVKLTMMNLKVRELVVKVEEEEEELNWIRDKKDETRKKRAGSPTLGGTSSKLSRATMMLLVIRWTMMGSEVANKFLKATGWVDLPSGFRFLPTSH